MIKESNSSKIVKLIIGFGLCFCFFENVSGQPGEAYRNNGSRAIFKLPRYLNLNDAQVAPKYFQHVSFNDISNVLDAIHKLGKDKKGKNGRVDKDTVECNRLRIKEVWEGLMANNKISWIEGGAYGARSMIGDNVFLAASGFVYPDCRFNGWEGRRRVIVNQKNS